MNHAYPVDTGFAGLLVNLWECLSPVAVFGVCAAAAAGLSLVAWNFWTLWKDARQARDDARTLMAGLAVKIHGDRLEWFNGTTIQNDSYLLVSAARRIAGDDPYFAAASCVNRISMV